MQICLAVQASHGKMLKDFLPGLENNKDIEELCAEVEAYAQKFPMPGFEMGQ
jgi:glycine hydroxymethyltransferase